MHASSEAAGNRQRRQNRYMASRRSRASVVSKSHTSDSVKPRLPAAQLPEILRPGANALTFVERGPLPRSRYRSLISCAPRPGRASPRLRAAARAATARASVQGLNGDECSRFIGRVYDFCLRCNHCGHGLSFIAVRAADHAVRYTYGHSPPASPVRQRIDPPCITPEKIKVPSPAPAASTQRRL